MPRVTSKLEIEQIEERRYAPLFDCHREGDRSVDNMMVQIGYVLRIFFAGICGLMIGIERRNRLKEAGIRTHLIVALGSALMMIVSKYGFFDLQGHSFLRADASRIASQIVSGIGFFGRGYDHLASPYGQWADHGGRNLGHRWNRDGHRRRTVWGGGCMCITYFGSTDAVALGTSLGTRNRQDTSMHAGKWCRDRADVRDIFRTKN